MLKHFLFELDDMKCEAKKRKSIPIIFTQTHLLKKRTINVKPVSGQWHTGLVTFKSSVSAHDFKQFI